MKFFKMIMANIILRLLGLIVVPIVWVCVLPMALTIVALGTLKIQGLDDLSWTGFKKGLIK